MKKHGHVSRKSGIILVECFIRCLSCPWPYTSTKRYFSIYFIENIYFQVLNIPPPQVTTVAADGEEINCTGKYDLRPFAAHNLALIYRCSGNDHLARQIYEKYLVV